LRVHLRLPVSLSRCSCVRLALKLTRFSLLCSNLSIFSE
jgi:hypothetical protein